MKSPYAIHSQTMENVPELIAHLWKLYSDMALDPTLSESAEHIKCAVLELEDIQKAAWEVYQEESAAQGTLGHKERPNLYTKRPDDDQDWFRNLRPATTSKQ